MLDERVIYQQYSGDVSLEDLYIGHTAIIKLLPESNARKRNIHVIIDMSRRLSLAPELLQLRNMRALFSYGDTKYRTGWLLIVQAKPNPVMRFVLIAAAKISGSKLRIMSSVEQAHTFLKRADTSLPDSFTPA